MEPISRISTTDQAIETIKKHILSGEYEEGDKLPSELSLSQQLSVGRSTIREALRVLQAMGYISIIHGRGAFLASKNPASIPAELWFAQNAEQLGVVYDLRNAIEQIAARLAAKQMTDAEIDALRQVQEQFERVLFNGSCEPQKLAMLDECFHDLISEGTHNPLLISICKKLSDAISPNRVKAFSIVQNQVNAVTPHRRILSAIAARSPEQASEAIAVHLTISKSDAMEAAHQSI
jgi:GntR family transcriptional repressor for pyruvate dehydrogenase complex